MRNRTHASKSASPPDLLLRSNSDSEPLILHSVLFSSLQMPVLLKVCITEDGVSTTHPWWWTNHRILRSYAQPHPIPSCLYLLLSLLCMHDMSLQSCPTLWTPWTVASQVPLSMGFPRQEHWRGLPFPPQRDLTDPGIKPTSPASPASQAESLPTEPPGKPLLSLTTLLFSTHHILLPHKIKGV